MPFDWFTILAQVINFLILLWLLRRFLYRPVLAGLDAREKRLADILANANAKNEAALRHEQLFQQKESKLQQQLKTIIDKAKMEAQELKIKLIKEARHTADELLLQTLAMQQNQIASAQQQVLDQTIKEVYATAGTLLEALSDLTLQQAIVNKFVSRLDGLTQKELETLSTASESVNTLIVRTAFELSDENQNAIKHALKKVLGKQKETTVAIDFIHVPKLLAGLELNVGGWKIAWSVEYFLKALQDRVSKVMQHSDLKQPSTAKPQEDLNNTAFPQ